MSALKERFAVRIARMVFRRAARAGLPRAIAPLLAAAACSHGGAEPSTNPAGFQLERPALRLSGSPPPRYPTELRATGDTGTVVLRAIVQPSGRIDAKSIEVISSPHPAFTRAAVQALRNSRFIPAEIGGDLVRPGKAVAQSVTVPYFFAPPPPPIRTSSSRSADASRDSR